jgi:uncharacterized protein (DUF362 family)
MRNGESGKANSKSSASTLSRRSFALGATGLAAASAFGARNAAADAAAETAERNPIDALVAKPPPGFTPLTMPGKIVKATAKGDFASFMQPNQLWPQADIARRLFERAMTEFTGAPNAVEAMKRFIHKDDAVAIKVNGIAGQNGHTMAVNFELILPVVEAVLAAGVPAGRVMVYEQYPTYLMGTRVNVRDWKLPEGVKVDTHNNMKHTMPDVRIYQGIKTRYCRFFTESTAVIDMTQIKDHSICGYTGTMKNITHGNINNPEDHHAHQASPQIAMLYNHPIVTSRVRLHITDAFKIIYDRGPLDRNPQTRIPHGAVYVATDAVAMDAYGWKVVDDERKAHGMKNLKESLREPRYIHTAGDLGVGIADMNRIRLKSVEA